MLIPPQVRARLHDLRLESRVPARSQSYGKHVGRSLGAGLEFAQYRAYEPGDELRRIDWKLYARADRFFVRDALRDSAQSVWVLLDTSASMSQADRMRPDYSKLDAAKILAACVIELASRQGDAVAIVTLGTSVSTLPVGRGARHRDRLFAALELVRSGGVWPERSQLQLLWQRIAPESMVIVISDGLDAGLPLLAEQLTAARRQVLSLGIVSLEERDFPFQGGFLFRDVETGAELRADAALERDSFLSRFAASRAALRQRLAACGARHVDHVLDEPPDNPLRRLLRP